MKRSDNDVPEVRFLTMGFEGQDVQVILWPETQGHGATRTGESLVDRGELFLESDDLRKDFEALQSKGVQFVEPSPEDYPFGVRVTALDPDGNRVSLRQLRR